MGPQPVPNLMRGTGTAKTPPFFPTSKEQHRREASQAIVPSELHIFSRIHLYLCE